MALTLEMRGHIERRTPRADGRLNRRSDNKGGFEQVLEMSGYDTPQRWKQRESTAACSPGSPASE